MSPERFEHLLACNLVAPCISKQKRKLQEPVGLAEHLHITLQYLVSGDSQPRGALKGSLGGGVPLRPSNPDPV